jgi:hypothetical protein
MNADGATSDPGQDGWDVAGLAADPAAERDTWTKRDTWTEARHMDDARYGG